MQVTLIAALAGGLLLTWPARAESLRGRVHDRAFLAEPKAKGLPAAKVTLYDTGGKRLAVKPTGKTGDYRFQGLKPGRYVIAVERKDCLPSPLVRVIEVSRGDTAARDFALDRDPRRNHSRAREAGKRKSAPHGYYTRLAEGMLAVPPAACLREAADPLSIGRFADAEDTSEAYRRLWTALLWAEIESQARPAEHMVYLAHALDSALKAAAWPALPALSRHLQVRPDSLEAYAARSRALILSSAGRKPLEGLKSAAVPKRLALEILDAHLASASIPLPKKKAFLAKAKGVLGAEASRKLALALGSREKAKQARKPGKAKPKTPEFDSEALRKVLAAAASGAGPNPVALYNVGSLHMEAGRVPEAIEILRKANGIRPDHPRALMAEARAHMANGDSASAGKLFESLVSHESPEWQARGWQGQALIQWTAGRAEAAEASLVKSLGMDDLSDSARGALMLLARISLERKTWSTVEPMLEDLIKARPREAEAHFWLGRMALAGKRDGVALDRFRQARKLAPDRTDFAVAEAEARFAREECGEALKVLKPLRARLGPDGLSIYGRCLLAQGRSREAALEFERMHKAKPSAAALVLLAQALNASGEAGKAAGLLADSPFNSQPDVRLVRAETHLALGQVEAARDALEPLRARSPEDPRLHYLLGLGSFKERDYPEASKELTEALRYRQDYPEAVHLQGACLLKLGRAGEAHHYFGELAAASAKGWRAKGLGGKGQAFAQEGKLEAAVEHLGKSFQEVPTAEAAAHMALVLLRQDKPREASGWADKARRLDPREPLALMAAVDVLLAEQRQDEAVAQAAEGLEKNPESCDFQMVAAKVSLRAGQDDRARDLSLRAVRSCPSEPAPHYYLGSLSARAGVKADAKRHFGAYLAAGGDAKRVPAGYR